MDSRVAQLTDAVVTDVLEKKVAEGHVCDSARKRFRDRTCHQALVLNVAARIRQSDRGQWETNRGGLRLQQLAANGMHRDAVRRAVHRRQETDDLEIRISPKCVESPGAVLSRAPGEHDAVCHHRACIAQPSLCAVLPLAKPTMVATASDRIRMAESWVPTDEPSSPTIPY